MSVLGALRMLVPLAAGVLAAWAFVPSAGAQPQPGDILVLDPDVPPVSTALLFRVDPQTGARTVLSNFGGSSPSVKGFKIPVRLTLRLGGIRG